MKKPILVCDRCGFILSDKDDIEKALEGQRAWGSTVRAKGVEPRGSFPCKNFVRCGGEMKLVYK